MKKNGYIKLEELEEVDFENEYDDSIRIEDLEIVGDERILVYKNDIGDGDEFMNIYSNIRMMITTYNTIRNDKYKKLPENIENVIVDGTIFNIREEFEMIIFMSEKRLDEHIRERGEYNKRTENGYTYLIARCMIYDKENKMRRREEMIGDIIDRTSDEILNSETENGETALMCACENILFQVSHKLIDRMSDECINIVSKDGETALFFACYNNMDEIALRLINRTSEENINRVDRYGDTAIYYGCKNKMIDVSIELIKRTRREILNRIREDGNSVLIWASYNRMDEIVRMLIPLMEDETVNATDTEGGLAVYWMMINEMEDEMIERVIDKMSDETINMVVYKRTYNMTLLITACIKNKKRVAKKLMERMREETINYVDNYNRTALFYACYSNMREIVFELIDRTDEENMKMIDTMGNIALGGIIKNKMEEEGIYMMRKMREGDIDIDETTIMFIINNRLDELLIEIIRKMSEESVDVKKIVIASYMKKERMIEELLKRMTDEKINSISEKSNTILHIVCINKQEEMAKIIIERMRKEVIMVRSHDISRGINGKTARDIAEELKMVDIVRLIDEK